MSSLNLNFSDLVILKDLATDLNLSATYARRYVLQKGLSFLRIRIKNSQGHRTVLALNSKDASYIKAVRSLEADQEYSESTSKGKFYILQVCPELSPNRVKLGYTKDIERRLSEYRTIAPTVRVLAFYDSLPEWEKAAISSLTRGSEQIGVEVFQVDSLSELKVRAKNFFQMMPEIL